MRFVYDDFKSTYEELLNKSNIPFLHIKRIRTMAVDTFRILNNMSPPVLSDLVRIWDCSSYNFRYQNVLQVPQVRTTKYGKKSFRLAAAVLWNSFPDNFRQVSSFNQFKALIYDWSGKDCKCNLCRKLFRRMPSCLSEFNRIFVVAISVLFLLCLFHFKLNVNTWWGSIGL